MAEISEHVKAVLVDHAQRIARPVACDVALAVVCGAAEAVRELADPAVTEAQIRAEIIAAAGCRAPTSH